MVEDAASAGKKSIKIGEALKDNRHLGMVYFLYEHAIIYLRTIESFLLLRIE